MKRKKRSNQNNNKWDHASKKVNNNTTPPTSPQSVNQNNSIEDETTQFTSMNPFNILKVDKIEEKIHEKLPSILLKDIVDYVAMCQLIRSHIGPKFTTRTQYDDTSKGNVQL